MDGGSKDRAEGDKRGRQRIAPEPHFLGTAKYGGTCLTPRNRKFQQRRHIGNDKGDDGGNGQCQGVFQIFRPVQCNRVTTAPASGSGTVRQFRNALQQVTIETGNNMPGRMSHGSTNRIYILLISDVETIKFT